MASIARKRLKKLDQMKDKLLEQNDKDSRISQMKNIVCMFDAMGLNFFGICFEFYFSYDKS